MTAKMRPALFLALFYLINSALSQDNIDDTIDSIFRKPGGAKTDRGNIDDILSSIYQSPTTPTSNVGNVATSVPGTGGCECVPYYLCNNNTIITDGYGVIDIRSKSNTREITKMPALLYRIDDGPCDYLSVCCNKPVVLPEPIKPLTKRKGCGNTKPEELRFGNSGDKYNEAQFAEFPWMAALLREEAVEENNQILLVYQCGAAVIHPQVLITSAHCVGGKDKQYKVRAGEWDTHTTNEWEPHQDRDVKTIIIHPEYYAGALFNNIAVLILDTPLEITLNVDVVCLPKQGMAVEKSRCFASGWGQDVFGKDGKNQVKLKKIELPIVSRNVCQDRLRTTRLGKHFQLHASFICAGGETGEDTCTGDGGSPLVCPISGYPGRYYQAGIVAWGIGCGENQIPGVYANVALFSDWVDEQLAYHNFNMSYYKY